MKRLDQMAAETLARPVDQQAIEFKKRWITWGDMRTIAERVNGLVAASGAGGGTKIALVARNRPSAIAAFLGLIAVRRTIRMVYPFQSAKAIARDIEKIEPSVVIAAEEDFSEDIFNTLQDKGIAAIALREATVSCEMDASAPKGFERSSRTEAVANDAQLEILTSGTTGIPKPFALDYSKVAQYIVGTGAIPTGQTGDPADLPPNIMFFPVGNISGLYSTLPPLLKGQRAVLLERFNVADWHDHLVRFRPVAGGLPPAGIQMVLDAELPREDFASLRFIGSGAAPLDPSVHRAFEERYGVPVLLSYGATEFAGPVASMTLDLYKQWGTQKPNSVGKALPGAQLRVIDPETGKELPPGQEGVLEVISPRIGPGWIRTSDIAIIDADGFIFHRGRADGAIIRGGFKLLPEAIERALLLHPAISVAGVLGIADKRLGQVPAAAIQLKPGIAPPSIAELETHLREHVPATHIPTIWKFVETMPRTPTLKVDRPALRQVLESASTK